MNRLKRAQQLRQRRSIAAMNRQIDAHLQNRGINLPNTLQSAKPAAPAVLDNVLQRSSAK